MPTRGRKPATEDRERHRISPPCPICHGGRYHAATCPEATDDATDTRISR